MPPPVFRQLTDEPITLLVYESTRGVRTEKVEVETPLTKTTGRKPASPNPAVIPIPRMGLEMLEDMTRLLPTAEVGFLGMRRDEQALVTETYADRLPQDLSKRRCFLVGPMLATGGALVAVISYVLECGACGVICTCLLTAPKDIAAVKDAVGSCVEVKVVVGGADGHLDRNAYITPGLGDIGDRLYGLV